MNNPLYIVLVSQQANEACVLYNVSSFILSAFNPPFNHV